MPQTIHGLVLGEIRTMTLPDSEAEVMPGITWGKHDVLFTPAFWAAQAWLCSVDKTESYQLGNSLREELAVCLLGGHGMPAEVGLAAFRRIKEAGLMNLVAPSEAQIFEVLSRPLRVSGREVKYRFAKQRSRYLSQSLAILEQESPPLDEGGAVLRDWLLKMPGIGPKTASWIARNQLGSDEVAIIDIHIYRAGLLAGFFKSDDNISKHYDRMEKSFICFAHGIGVRASALDALIWQTMKYAGKAPIRLTEKLQLKQNPRHKSHLHVRQSELFPIG